jgi:hypothetical protein
MGKSNKKSKGRMCVSFEESSDNLLGAIFLRNYDISYDIENKALSFVRARCDDSSLFGSFDKDNRLLISKKPVEVKQEKKTSKAQSVGDAKHLLNVTIEKDEPYTQFERYSNKHFKARVQEMIFKSQFIENHIYPIIIMFGLGVFILLIFMIKEGCSKEASNRDRGYEEFVDENEEVEN